ncbi:DUF2207 domain-containing protein [Nocardia farcinica]|uniref:DUF2207 family protein n=1 Tax=Nocardia farcinica TaxID=37329 RepID=UPI001894F59B|nr:DUF2207 domain-containing protein [Nocardia farcinica]MBF6264106.1 DUF2207 domain-containing protein [Nocardia farcinica]MBF6283024.1 DUF2207 domain-containing protein [Nocardia farcinica]MBF6294926.1 DUF2207 domain-containing protein [Nocardia farcinica]MBF6306972.1 DUF2207 domain-containing protein [Nocardia farcinica]MBF6375879.1 DUF2207 domain-containing protein [Nocardia farcinica]
MLTFRGAAASALLLAAAASVAAAPVAQAQPAPAGVVITADLVLDREGVLRVEETVSVPEGAEFRMSLPLRLQVEPDVERRFRVTDVETGGVGSATTADDRFTLVAPPGESTFRYAVHNTVGDAPSSQVFHWLGVVDTDIAAISAALVAPSYELAIVDCTLGPPGNTRPCADVRTEAIGVLHLEQTDLRKGDAIDLTVQLPPGTVPANADVIDHSGPGPFSLSGPVLAAFGALLALLAGLAALVWRARRDNAAATTGSEVFDPLAREDGQVRFTAPDGVLPGEAGLLLDEHVDPVDIAATVVDLAVRRYLWVTQIAENDWRITRVNAPDDQLRDFEKAVYTALLPDGVDAVTMGELRGRVQAGPVRAAMIADAVARGAFVDRSRPGPAVWLGGALVVAGLAATVGLAVTAGYALVGVAILLAGVALVLLPKYLPSPTAAGSRIAGRVRALQRGLDATRPEQIPPTDQETVFSRALPYTVVGGRADNWVRAFRQLNPAADAQPGLYWFGGYERDRDLHRFAAHFPYFITALEGLFSETSH